jgi:hypothetical protein
VARTTGGLSIEVDGLTETLRAVQGLAADLERPAANTELRNAADRCARDGAAELALAAGASGVPVAPRVARSIRVKRDRLPVLSIGGGIAVGRRGAPAGALVWGSEQGPKGHVNHFGVPPGSGYWIAPAVERFKSSGAVDIYKRAVVDVLRHWRLL